MRLLLSILAVFLLLGGTVPLVAMGDEERATHTPFAEFATFTTCTYCKYAHNALKELYAENNHDFYYVSLVTDVNATAYDRVHTNYKIKSYPTTYFDGGFKLNVGAGSTSAAKTAYSTSLTACENRVVNDVDIKVEAKWLGNASMEICVNVQNNTPGDYDAIVRCYVTEIESSMGWLDTFGNPYTFAFLDYAVYTLETIASNDSWGICTIWDGNPLGYGGIQRDNIMIIATVSEKDAHTGYSDPPSGNPFVAYYLDDATATVPQTLLVDSDTLPASGGIINYSVSAGVENANRNYYLLGSVTGTEPGLPLPGGMVTLPLVWDPLTDLMLNLANSPALPNWRGVLDASGQAIPGPQLNTWGPVPPTAVGTTIYAAYLLYYIPSYYPYDFVSNPVSFEIVP